MGFLLNDALIIAKARCNLKVYNDLYTLGKPRSFVLAKDLKFIFSEKILIKLNLNFNIFDKELYKRLFGYDDNKIVSFDFFSKLLKFKNNFDIDIMRKKRPKFLLDITNFQQSKKLFKKADFIYDTGSLGYVNNIGDALNNLTRILKKNGIIVHSLPSNGYTMTGNVQFNKKYLEQFYKSIRWQILFIGFAFFQSFFTKFLIVIVRGGIVSRSVDIDQNPSTYRISNYKNAIFYVVRNSLCTRKVDNIFFTKCFTISKFFRKYIKIIFVINKFK